MSVKIHIPHIHISSPANFPGPPSVNLEIKGDLSFLRNDDEVCLGYNLHWLPGDVLITGIVKNKVAFLPGAVQEADPMAILEQLIKKGQQKSEKTPKNEKTSKQLLGEFYSDKKHLESLLEDKGTVLFFLHQLLHQGKSHSRCATSLFTLMQFWPRGQQEMGSNWRMSSRTAFETSPRALISGVRRNPLAHLLERQRTRRWEMTSLLRVPPSKRSAYWRA